MAAHTMADGDVTDSVTLSSTAGNVREVIFNKNHRTATIESTDTVYVGQAGTDDTAKGDNFITYAAGEPFVVELCNGRSRNLQGTRLYIAGVSVSQVVRVAARRF